MTPVKLKAISASDKVAQVFAEVETLISLGNASGALNALSQLSGATAVEQRIALHLKGKAHMLNGDWKLALVEFERAKNELGANIRLLCEISNCHYLAGEVGAWRNSLLELRSEFAANREKFSQDSFRIVLVNNAKFFEEQGDIATAVSAYQEALRKLDLQLNTDEYLFVASQLMRLQRLAQNPIEKLSQQYREFMQFEYLRGNEDLFIEIQHALMLAEVELVGMEFAVARLLSILEQAVITDYDKAFVFFDLFEALIVESGELEVIRELLQGFSVPAPSDSFESVLHTILQTGPLALKDVTRLATSVTLAGYLRILRIHILLGSPVHAAAFRNQYEILLKSLPTDSRAYWVRGLAKSEEPRERNLILSQAKKAIVYEGREVSLRNRPVLFSFLSLLASRSVQAAQEPVAIDLFCQELWQAEYNPALFDRLRMQAREANKILAKLTGIERAIRVRSQGVELIFNILISLDN